MTKEFHILRLEDAPVAMKSPEGRKLYTSDKIGLVHLRLDPGEAVETHINPLVVVFYVLEGTGTVTLDKQEIECSPGTVIEVPAGLNRGWQNRGDSVLRLLVVKSLT
jgi:quercetin dioxygenase-like cupin family protein